MRIWIYHILGWMAAFAILFSIFFSTMWYKHTQAVQMRAADGWTSYVDYSGVDWQTVDSQTDPDILRRMITTDLIALIHIMNVKDAYRQERDELSKRYYELSDILYKNPDNKQLIDIHIHDVVSARRTLQSAIQEFSSGSTIAAMRYTF